MVQLYETMMTRHTTMIVGPTGGGKSVVINTLAQAQTRLALQTKLYTINPKDRSVIELYGRFINKRCLSHYNHLKLYMNCRAFEAKIPFGYIGVHGISIPLMTGYER